MIILVELLKLNYEKHTVYSDPEVYNEKKSKIMFRQGLTIAKWINKFDPERLELMSDETNMFSENLKDFEKFVNDAIDEIGEYLFSKPRNLFKRKNNVGLGLFNLKFRPLFKSIGQTLIQKFCYLKSFSRRKEKF